MRIKPENHTLEIIGEAESTNFQIRANGKAFRVLIDGLYSDKISSIVRELTANAADSHVAAGQSRPFYVHAPSDIRPEFYVRDEGEGMSHEKVVTLYSTLFASDKDESDDLVGAFGLGSKTPFAYSDQFFLSCYDGNSVRHYVAAIGKDGYPKIILIETTDSDEPRGVKVGFSVDEKDFGEFSKAVKRISLGHTPPFDSNIELPSLGEPLLQGPGWTAYKKDVDLAQWNVRQGCVIYPLDSKAGFVLPAFWDKKFILECPIGSIRVTTSRELIEYTPDVVEYLNARIEALKEEVVKSIKQQTNSIESVARYFSTVRSLIPPFVSYTPKHPFTGLTSERLNANDGANWFLAYRDDDRWFYEGRRDAVCVEKTDTVYVLKDTEALRGDTAGISAEEATKIQSSQLNRRDHRRFVRMIRGFADFHELSEIKILMDNPYSEEFLKYCFPGYKLINVSVKDLLAKQKKKERTSAPKIIKGLTLYENKGKEASELYELEEPDGSTIYVNSRFYRSNHDELWKVAEFFGFSKIISATKESEDKVALAGYPGLVEFIQAKLPKPWTVAEFAQLYKASKSNGRATVLYLVWKYHRDLFDKFSTVKQMKPLISRLRPLLEAGLFRPYIHYGQAEDKYASLPIYDLIGGHSEIVSNGYLKFSRALQRDDGHPFDIILGASLGRFHSSRESAEFWISVLKRNAGLTPQKPS